MSTSTKEKSHDKKPTKPIASPLKPAAAVKSALKKHSRRHKNNSTYNTYIYRVLKQVHPEIGISKRGMAVMDSFVNDLFGRIAAESGQLARFGKRKTLGSREVQAATRLVLPGELNKHGVSEGTKACTVYAHGEEERKVKAAGERKKK